MKINQITESKKQQLQITLRKLAEAVDSTDADSLTQLVESSQLNALVPQAKQYSAQAIATVAKHIAEGVPFCDSVFRYGSDAYFETIDFARTLHGAGLLETDWESAELLESDIGTTVRLKGIGEVRLDTPYMEDATPEEEELFHQELDKLIHKTFGHSDVEKKKKHKDVAEASPAQQLSKYNPNSKTYRGVQNKMPHLDPDDPVFSKADSMTGREQDTDLSYDDSDMIDNAHKEKLKKLIAGAVDKLPPKRKFVLIKRYGLDGGREHSLEEIGKMLGTTREYAKDAEAKALRTLRKPERLGDLDEAEYQGKDVDLNKPKRGGSKKFYVYVKNPKTGKVKKVSFGADSGGGKLAVKLKDPKARKAFADRHNCDQKNDKTKAGYWSCRLPRYAKSLGLSGGGTWW